MLCSGTRQYSNSMLSGVVNIRRPLCMCSFVFVHVVFWLQILRFMFTSKLVHLKFLFVIAFHLCRCSSIMFCLYF